MSSKRTTSRNDLDVGNLPALKAEEEAQVGAATRKITFQMAGHDGGSVLLLGGQRLAGVDVFGSGRCLPLLDRSDTRVVWPSSFTTAPLAKQRAMASASSLSAAKYSAIGSGSWIVMYGLHHFDGTKIVISGRLDNRL
jgi:hypothetical protein